jgi:hypothetical protein
MNIHYLKNAIQNIAKQDKFDFEAHHFQDTFICIWFWFYWKKKYNDRLDLKKKKR